MRNSSAPESKNKGKGRRGPEADKAIFAFVNNAQYLSPDDKSEVSEEWVENAKKAWRYYVTNGWVRACIDAWRIMALGEDFAVISENDELQKGLTKEFARLKARRWLADNILQLIVKGDCVAFREQSDDQIKRLITVNPISVAPVYENGTLIEMIQHKGDPKKEKSLPLDQTLHVRWMSPEFEPHGISMVLPAFDPLSMLAVYRAADKAIAKRFATPLRLIKIGGQYGSKTILPDQNMLDDYARIIDQMDMRKGLVVPMYVDAKTDGAEGATLDLSLKIAAAKEEVMVSLGISRALITGDGPNYATAQVAFKTMALKINEIIDRAIDLLRFAGDEWCRMNEFSPDEYYIEWPEIDPDNSEARNRILLELYDRNIVGKRTMQLKTGFNPENENKQGEERKIEALSAMEAVALVNAYIMSPEEARKKMKLEGPAPVPKPVYTNYNPAPAAADGKPHIHAVASKETTSGELLRQMEEEQTFLQEGLAKASKKITEALKELEASDVDKLTKSARKKRLEQIAAQISVIQKNFESDLSADISARVHSALYGGASMSVEDLIAQNAPQTANVANKDDFAALVAASLSKIDKAAVEALIGKRLELMGSVSKELADSIMSELTAGIIGGLPITEIAKNIGVFVADPEEFKKAGGRIYSSVNSRLRTIAHSETLKAYNRGAITTYDVNGVEEAELVNSPGACREVCAPLNGKRYKIAEAYSVLPLHPNCECTWRAILKNYKPASNDEDQNV